MLAQASPSQGGKRPHGPCAPGVPTRMAQGFPQDHRLSLLLVPCSDEAAGAQIPIFHQGPTSLDSSPGETLSPHHLPQGDEDPSEEEEMEAIV